MPHKKRHRRNPVSHHIKPHNHHYKSEATSDKNKLFHHVKNANAGVTQNVNVNVKVEPSQDDCLTGCFAMLGKCFGK